MDACANGSHPSASYATCQGAAKHFAWLLSVPVVPGDRGVVYDRSGVWLAHPARGIHAPLRRTDCRATRTIGACRKVVAPLGFFTVLTAPRFGPQFVVSVLISSLSLGNHLPLFLGNRQASGSAEVAGSQCFGDFRIENPGFAISCPIGVPRVWVGLPRSFKHFLFAIAAGARGVRKSCSA